MIEQPALAAIIVLSMGTLFMNGAHDAANAIATAVATRSIRPGRALLMAALCNFFGVSLATLISTAVAKTMVTMVNFSGDNQSALIALCAAMVAIIIWGGATWYFGIPSSQSHALIAGVTGAAIALQGGTGGINFNEWVKVIWGLLVAVALGFFLGWGLSKLTGVLFRSLDKRKSEKVFARLLNVTAGVLAFEHGMQDGQKFMGVCFLAIALAMGADQSVDLEFPMWLMVMCSLCMLIGTAVGGTNIIKNVGLNIVRMDKWQGLTASLSAAICIGISNMTGLPISTTHANTTAIMGVGTAKGRKAVNWGASTNMAKAWVYTFPGCGLMGFVFAKVFMLLF
ncbi:MAG: inorganic phosphate transporter [Eggerthellaceae bacterium]|nr:inorganic phosphate transporter [Eggerthellaceae bacterium]